MRKTGALLLAVFLALLRFAAPVAADDGGAQQEVEFAAALPLTGDETTFGTGSLEGIQLAIDEANVSGRQPRFKLVVYDDASDDAKAEAVARRVAASRAVLVLGPALSTSSLSAGPVYADAGMASLTTTATSDLITRSRTTFRVAFKNSDQGRLLAAYLARVLNRKTATVIWIDNGYGQSLRQGFEEGVQRFGLRADYFAYKTPDEIDATLARALTGEADRTFVLLTLDADGARFVAGLRRSGVTGPILGDDSFGDESFSARLADAPEEIARPGALTDGVMGLSPMILDSANARILTFAERFRARFGHDPVWFSTASYDAALAAIAATRAAVNAGGDPNRLRAAIVDYLEHATDSNTAVPGLLGPIVFDADRGRPVAIRVGQFSARRFESAPLQLVPDTDPDPAEITSQSVFEIGPGAFVQRQRVVYTGVFLNDISRIDLPQSRFTADFYVWMRYVANQGGADPEAIDFPDLVRGSSDGKRLAAQIALGDGTTYKLWQMRGDFKSRFDLHKYPADSQTLALRFFNAQGSSNSVVYVRDRRATGPSGPPAPAGGGSGGVAAVNAFRELTQWNPVSTTGGRDTLVTDSALGDPRLSGLSRYRELSGFTVVVEVKRRVVATLIKTLLPLVLMAMIMYATLHFPPVLIKEKVTVAVTAALTGAVLLSSINSQLGAVGYVMAVEYVFYVFFALCLLAIVTALAGERLRAAGRATPAVRVEKSGELLFVVALIGIIGTTALAVSR